MKIEPDAHRKFSRVSINRHVNVEFTRSLYNSCQIKDLSFGGMFAKGDFSNNRGKKCNIEVILPNVENDLSFHALAKVVRKTHEGVAIEFTSMPFESYLFLQSTLLKKADIHLNSHHELPDENCPFQITDS